MQKHIFLALAIAGSIFPIGAYAIQKNPQDEPQEFERATAKKITQHHALSRKRDGEGERMNRMLQQLDLTAEQSQEIEAIKQELKNKNDAFQQQVRDHRRETRSLLASDTPTEELRQQYQETQSLLRSLDDNRFEMRLQVREVLTPEQRVQLAELIEQEKNHRKRDH